VASEHEPILNYSFDACGNLRIFVPVDKLLAFGNWLNDEHGDAEREMYELMKEIGHAESVHGRRQ